MKRISFFLALTLLVFSFGLANAEKSMTLENIGGYYLEGGVDKLVAGAEITMDVTVVNNGTPDCFFAPSFAFVWSSSDGAEWGGVTFDYGAIYEKEVIAGVFVPQYLADLGGLQQENFSVDGLGGDTVGFALPVIPPAIGFFDGMDATVWTFTLNPTLASNGKHICVSTAQNAINGYEWSWNSGSTGGGTCTSPAAITVPFTYVDGQSVTHDLNQQEFCFEIGTPPDFAPVLNNAPVTLEGSHCEVLSFDFDIEDPDPGAGPGPDAPLTFSADIGTIDANTGVWTYTGDLSEVGAAITLTVVGHENDNALTDTAIVNIVMTNIAPEFDACPTEVFFAQTNVLRELAYAGTDDCSGDPMIMTVLDADGLSAAAFNGNVLEITGAPGEEGLHTLTIGISDGVDDGATCTVNVTLSAGALYGLQIEKTHGTLQGGFVDVDVTLFASGGALGGYSLLLAYDASALTFQGATPGQLLTDCKWEYFTYRYGANGNCSGGCPSGLVSLTAIAETNNGPNHPEVDCAPEDVSVATLSFLVSNDRTLNCQYVPIRFFWVDCTDNTLTDAAGEFLYIASTVKEYPYDGVTLGENLMITYPDAVLPTFVGPMGCAGGDKVDIVEDIDFINGGIDIVCSDSIDARGDLNLDGLGYTIADAVMYSNYFINGIIALKNVTEANQYGYVPGYAGSIAASDVNADGLTLTVADLVYLIRVVVGDALPYPKVVPEAANLLIGNDVLAVSAEMGAAYVVIAGDNAPTLLADGMEMKSAFDGVNTRVLVWSVDGNTFTGEFLGNVGNVISTELATAEGAPVVAKELPMSFGLDQNYPNPFNPTTTIGLALPSASDYSLTIYNVTGQIVTEFNGNAEAGFHSVEWDASNNASGVYFYKLTAGNFTETKKMVLMK